MTHVADIMYKALRYRDGYITTKALALSMNILDKSLNMSDRTLRGHGEDVGLIGQCSREIFKETGYCIITRMNDPAGVRLTNDKSEIESAKNQWASFVWNTKKRLDEYDEYLRTIDSVGLGPLFERG